MNDKQAPGRPSGIPRFSRLPVPRSAVAVAPAPAPAAQPVVRPAASREGLNSGLRNPRLRPAASRDQLAPAPVLKKPEPRAATKPKREVPPPAAARQAEARAPRSLLKSVRSIPRLDAEEHSLGNPPTPPEEPDAIVKRSTSLTSPSESWASTPHSQQATTAAASQNTNPPVDNAESDALRGRLKPRPSLAERTMETLSQLPSSPALRKKPSSFFEPEGASRPRSRAESGNSRPGSSYTSDGSIRPTSQHSRPGSSSGTDEHTVPNARPPTSTYKPLGSVEGTPSRKVSGVRSLKAPSVRTPQASPSTAARPSTSGIPSYQSPSPTRPTASMPPPKTPKTGANTSRPLKPRASVNGLFKKPSLPTLAQTSPASVTSPAPGPQKLKAAKSYGSLRKPTPTKPSLPAPAATEAPPNEFRKTSAALRDQIAKARAAKRAAEKQVTEAPPIPDTTQETVSSAVPSATENEPPIVPADEGFDFGIGVAMSHDPFNTRSKEDPKGKVIQQRLGAARSSGRLNIAALNLNHIPVEVLKMYDMESLGKHDGSWAESVDLTRFVAADNELETIEDSIFPDITPEQMAEDDESSGNIFGGLEAMDLHGNLLISLPIGLRQLRLLTSLNLSQNRLANSSIEVITEVTALRDLKLANNLLYGPLDPAFSKLENLEIFDLHGNNVSALPADIENLSRLRILNLSDNSFESLPFKQLAQLPLTELTAKKNKLSGTLIEDGVAALQSLQMLDLSSNQLTHLVTSGSTISLPCIHQLVLSMNRLKELPNISSWTSLITLTANENAIQEFPEGFMGLEKLRSVDFSSNDIRVVPPEISRMDNLSLIRLSGNPLRDKKFVSATTEELKDVLAARLEPPEPFQEPIEEAAVTESTELDEIADGFRRLSIRDVPPPPPIPADETKESDSDDFATPPTSSPTSPARSRSRTLANETWPIKSGGVLDRSNTKSSSLHPVVCSRVAADNKVREVQLHHNLFTCFPNSLSFFAESLAALSLAHNQLVGETYLTEELELPVLRELNLVSNHITSLVPLTLHLNAPQLEKMDVSLNRITALPIDLRAAFPRLIVLLAANNHLIELNPDTIKGLEVVDAGNNDIAHLNPRLGLLGGSGGLKRLEVSGNRFRVPRYSVLERGTDATLRWLRGRVPVAEMASWKDGEGDEGSNSDTSLADVD
ncbi:Leucine-rich repeat-containing protein 40 [Colletotrichum trifolii]|uniref:Leucine-rich repeat-containing protein 40 n=1 Tax=Colletotrichum trifolii TaxID=5466 RepID=A0A4R8RIZ3_COLTR|nr:Leucine-rich repeat-containing protein 40 [Colletotrichum trifolii]